MTVKGVLIHCLKNTNVKRFSLFLFVHYQSSHLARTVPTHRSSNLERNKRAEMSAIADYFSNGGEESGDTRPLLLPAPSTYVTAPTTAAVASYADDVENATPAWWVTMRRVLCYILFPIAVVVAMILLAYYLSPSIFFPPQPPMSGGLVPATPTTAS